MPTDQYDLRSAFTASLLLAGSAHESPLLSVQETADYVRRPKSWVYHVLRYDIPVVKLGQHIYFEKRELDAYIANCREVPTR